MTRPAPLIRCLTAPNPSPLTASGTNTYLIGHEEVAVIDPGPDSDPHLAAILASLGRGTRLSHIIVTHAHRDHSALARRLSAETGAPVLAFGDAFSGQSPRMAALAPQLGPAGDGLDTGFKPDLRLADGDRLDGPDWELVVHHTPGHLGGHLCLALGETLFSSDHVMGWSTSIVAPPDGDMADYMASLHRLATGSWQQFLPGHGAPIPNPAARIAELIAHRQAREAAILTWLEEGPTHIPALTQAIYHDIPARLLPAAERSVLAHLIDLLDRNLVSAQPEVSPSARYAPI